MFEACSFFIYLYVWSYYSLSADLFEGHTSFVTDHFQLELASAKQFVFCDFVWTCFFIVFFHCSCFNFLVDYRQRALPEVVADSSLHRETRGVVS